MNSKEALNKLAEIDLYIRSLSGENSDFPGNLIDEILEGREGYNIDTEAFLCGMGNCLSEREQKVIFKRYKDGLTLEQIAKEENVTRERIRQIISKSIRKLKHPGRLKKAMKVSRREYDLLQQENARLKALLLANGTKESTITNLTIEELDLSVRSYNCLLRAGITDLEKLKKLSADDLMRVRNLGKKSMQEVLETLHKLGIELKEV